MTTASRSIPLRYTSLDSVTTVIRLLPLAAATDLAGLNCEASTAVHTRGGNRVSLSHWEAYKWINGKFTRHHERSRIEKP